MMSADAEIFRRRDLARVTARVFQRRWSPAAWASIGLGILFIVVTCWWLSRDDSVPVYDAAIHLDLAIDAYEALSSGHLQTAFTEAAPYPPLTYLVGALGVFVGGVGVAPPIIAQNLVFVPLLALGCYKVGRLAFGPLAGLLAVVFVLGSPLIVEEFHEFMLDAPEAAMVAVAVWAILATEHFSRPGVSALAGVVVGLGMLSKETFVFFVAGVVLATAVRGGRRATRGVVVFAAAVLVIALPWYVYEFSRIDELGNEAFGSWSQLSGTSVALTVAPPRLSTANLEWYFWSVLNWQLYLPLFAFAAAGWIWTVAGFARRRPVSGFAPELAFGGFISWAALTETYVHAARYSIPMVVYLAVFGVGWVSRLSRPGQAVMATALALIALVNSLGVGFGVGRRVASAPLTAIYEQQPGTVTLHSTHGLWIGAPRRGGDMLGLMQALRRDGVREVRWYSARETDIEFSLPGIAILARIAGLGVPGNGVEPAGTNRRYAFLTRIQPGPSVATPCIKLRNGAGVWVRLGGSDGPEPWNYCPQRRS